MIDKHRLIINTLLFLASQIFSMLRLLCYSGGKHRPSVLTCCEGVVKGAVSTAPLYACVLLHTFAVAFSFFAPAASCSRAILWIARMIQVASRKFPPSGAAKAIPRANADQEMNEQTKGALAA